MKCVARRLLACDFFRTFPRDTGQYQYVDCYLVLDPITGMPTNRLPILTVVAVSKWGKFVTFAGAFRHFRFTNAVSFTVTIVAGVG